MSAKLHPGFGKRLSEERERLGFTQKEFAERAGIRRVTQCLYESEDSVPNYRYFAAIETLGADLSFLFFANRQSEDSLIMNPRVLKEIFQLVHQIGRDDKGKPLSLEAMSDIFFVLCAAYSGRNDKAINIDSVANMLHR